MLTKKRIIAKGNITISGEYDHVYECDLFDIAVQETKYNSKKITGLDAEELRFLYEVLKEYYQGENI